MYPIITSTANETVKYLRRLATSAKARRETGRYFAEGVHVVRSFLSTGAVPDLFVTAESAQANDEVAQLVAELTEHEVRQASVSDDIFTSLTTIHASVGIAMVFTRPTVPLTQPLTNDAVLLEDVQDPGNLGTMLRTIAAVGISTVILSSSSASPWSPKALRAGMGAQFSLEIYEDQDLAHLVETATVPSFVTTLVGESVSLYEADLRQPAVWIFGNEGQGVSQELVERATTRVIIPQAQTAVESLNVSAATAVCLYEQLRQRRT